MTDVSWLASLPTPGLTSSPSWEATLAFVSPAVVAVLYAIASWVAHHGRGTSSAEPSTWEETSANCDEHTARP